MHLHNQKLLLNWYLCALTLERSLLYERIEKRIDQMISMGLIDETNQLMEKFGRDAFALGSIGYRHCRNYIDGIWNKDEMVYQLKLDTRHYAKRQLIWFRKIKEIHWYTPDKLDEMKKDVEHFLNLSSGTQENL